MRPRAKVLGDSKGSLPRKCGDPESKGRASQARKAATMKRHGGNLSVGISRIAQAEARLRLMREATCK